MGQILNFYIETLDARRQPEPGGELCGCFRLIPVSADFHSHRFAMPPLFPPEVRH